MNIDQQIQFGLLLLTFLAVVVGWVVNYLQSRGQRSLEYSELRSRQDILAQRIDSVDESRRELRQEFQQDFNEIKQLLRDMQHRLSNHMEQHNND